MNAVLLPDELIAALSRLLGYQQEQRAAEELFAQYLVDQEEEAEVNDVGNVTVGVNDCVNEADSRYILQPSGELLQRISRGSEHCVSRERAQNAPSATQHMHTHCCYMNTSITPPCNLPKCQSNNSQQMSIPQTLHNQLIPSQSISSQLPICPHQKAMQHQLLQRNASLQPQQQQEQQQQTNQSIRGKQSNDRYSVRSQSAPNGSTRECQRGFENFCNPENPSNIMGLQRSTINQSVVVTPTEVVQQEPKPSVERTHCLANASEGYSYPMCQNQRTFPDQSNFHNATCCSKNDTSDFGMHYGKWQEQQQQQQQNQLQQYQQQQQQQQQYHHQQQQQQYHHQQQQQQYHNQQQQQQYHHQQQQKPLQQYQQQLEQQQQQQQQQHWMHNNNESYNRFEPNLNSTMIGQEICGTNATTAESDCMEHSLPNRSCMPQAQPYRASSQRASTQNTQRCHSTYIPSRIQPPTQSNCGQRMAMPEMPAKQRFRCDRSCDETSYMQLPVPQRPAQYARLPQQQQQPQVSFRNNPKTTTIPQTPRPRTQGAQCCLQQTSQPQPHMPATQGPRCQSPITMNQTINTCTNQSTIHSPQCGIGQCNVSSTTTNQCSIPCVKALPSSSMGPRFPESMDMSSFNQNDTCFNRTNSTMHQINTENMTPEERFASRTKSLFFETLVKDHTNPGVIQETLNGKEDFNQYAYEMAYTGILPNKPEPVDPITIIEAIKMRIDYERSEIRKNYLQKRIQENVNDSSDQKYTKEQSRCKDQRTHRSQSLSSKKTKSRNILSSENIDHYFAGKNKSEVNDALCAFLKAENKSRDSKTKSHMDFEANVNGFEPNIMGEKIKVYTGTTRPIN